MSYMRITSPTGRSEYGHIEMTDEQMEKAIEVNIEHRNLVFRAGDVLTAEQLADLGIRASTEIKAD